ncbi:MAG: leucyl aminopeptidase [Rhodoluna sp.]
MSQLKISTATKAPASKSNTAYVVGIKSTANKLQLIKGAVDTTTLASADLEQLGASSKPDSLTKLNFNAGSLLAIAGCGDGKFSEKSLRSLGGSVARNLMAIPNLIFDLPGLSKSEVIALLEGAALGAYEFNSYKSKPTFAKLANVTAITNHKIDAKDLKRISVIAHAVNGTRDLVNTPPNDLFPASMTKLIQAAVKATTISIEVWDEKALAKQGFGGLTAVGAGSTRPPRLVKLEFKPRGAKKHVALVGKGITFDSGGLSLKPAEAMVGMKYDMTGAATVFQTILAIAKLAIPVKTTAWLCLAENLPSGSAARPNDVIKARNGKTIEVLNTDAEGRLVLADGLSIAAEAKPDLIIDVATLTGAATVALGDRFAGLMGDELAINLVKDAAESAGELVWPMPMPDELRTILNSDIADIANVKIGNRSGGMLVGAHFLREFVPAEIPWAHLDIAGPAENSGGAYGYTPKGGTGAYVRTLIELIEAF